MSILNEIYTGFKNMRLSNKTQYACLALIHLSENYEKDFIRIEDIAEQKKIPKKFLEKILISLKNAKYIRSRIGAGGGYQLTKKPEKINIAEIVRLMDGPIAPVVSASKYYYANSPIESNKKLLNVFKEIRNHAASILEKTTFADLISNNKKGANKPQH